jgi:hypothetical protein
LQKHLESLGCTVVEKKEVFKPDFPAAFVNSLQAKDKKNSWIEYRKQIETKNIEEVYGVMIYAYKQLVLARSMQKLDEKSGVKEFQYRQALQNSKARTQTEILDTYLRLVQLYAESRRAGIPLETLAESFVLE